MTGVRVKDGESFENAMKRFKKQCEKAGDEEDAQELVARRARDAMSLKERLDQDLKTAMREKAQLRLDTIRMLKSAVKYREIELMKPLDDAGIHAVISSEVKRRRDAVEQYKAGNRPELADKEDAEIAILQAYLPQQLSREELEAPGN